MEMRGIYKHNARLQGMPCPPRCLSRKSHLLDSSETYGARFKLGSQGEQSRQSRLIQGQNAGPPGKEVTNFVHVALVLSFKLGCQHRTSKVACAHDHIHRVKAPKGRLHAVQLQRAKGKERSQCTSAHCTTQVKSEVNAQVHNARKVQAISANNGIASKAKLTTD